MKVIYESKAEIVKGESKQGNEFYGVLVALNENYKYFTLLQNADRELVRQMELKLSSLNKNE